MKKVALLFITAVTSVIGQTTYTIPFASSGNIIELAVANSGEVRMANVRVRVENTPSWLQFVQKEQQLNAINAGEEQPATFVFSVDKSAPVNQEQAVTFVVATSTGESWTKKISIAVAPPEKFELFQNYPNPFNPTTVISYQLPVSGRVSLKVYNLLGQEVTTLVNGEQLAGYHQETFDTRGLASGIYVYQLVATTDGARSSSRRVMALVK